MIRFIDLTGQIYLDDNEGSFAFYDTVRDKFYEFSGCQLWDTIDEFKNDYTGDQIERFLSLIPSSFSKYEWKEIKLSVEGKEIEFKGIEYQKNKKLNKTK